MASESRRDWIILGVVGFVFFVSSLILASADGIFLSPDETANAFFAETFATQGRLYAYEPLNAELGDVLFPRSIAAVDGRLLPGSFLGLPVFYGLIGRVVGTRALPLLTPLLALLAVGAWYAVVRKLFDRRVALYAALALFACPAFWYYASRGFMHNVPFTAFLIFAAFFFAVKPLSSLWKSARWNRVPDAALCGTCLGLAAWFRTAEAPWMAVAAVLAFAAFRKRIHRREIAAFALAGALTLFPMMFLNQSLYGSPLATGYSAASETENQASVSTETAASQTDTAPSVSAPDVLSSFLFPFGLHLRLAAKNVAWYGLGLFWWLSLLAVIGLPLALPQRKDRDERRAHRWLYLVLFGFIGAWLALVYGSWLLHDNPDPEAVTIANSYVRYWLPAFVMATPFIGLAIAWLRDKPLTKLGGHLVAAALFLLVFTLGIRATFFTPGDGLAAARDTLRASRAIQESVLSKTESDAVIIVDRADKLFFPHRSVRYPLRDEATYALMPRLVLRAPLYYYGVTFPEIDMTYLNTRKLKELGLQIELIETYQAESLYRITQTHE